MHVQNSFDARGEVLSAEKEQDLFEILLYGILHEIVGEFEPYGGRPAECAQVFGVDYAWVEQIGRYDELFVARQAEIWVVFVVFDVGALQRYDLGLFVVGGREKH